MSFFGKLKFWKREDDFNFDNIASKEMGSLPHDELNPNQPPMEEKSMFQDPAVQDFHQDAQLTHQYKETPSSGNRELELINSKLDTIKALLNSLDQRVGHLEQSNGVGRKENKLW
ncbi:MAG: hypothetical protein Q7J06_07015 [Bacteroidales bacterium]|nr:hypothetical protein [Bacteroidales bacterium]